MVFNAVVYAVQAVLWVLAGLAHSNGTLALLRIISSAFIALVSISAAVGFLLYGGRLFLMLRRWALWTTASESCEWSERSKVVSLVAKSACNEQARQVYHDSTSTCMISA